jgi:hypothetical protein
MGYEGKPIPRNLQIGKYVGKHFHGGQPEFQNRNPDERAKTCHKCLKPGHLITFCQNIMGCLKSCSEMPGYENTYFKNSSVIPLRNSVFIGHASRPPQIENVKEINW